MDPLTVVIADDEEPARFRLRTLLERLEGVIIVGEASDGDEVLSQIRDKEPDAVFLDIRMPGLSGLDVAELLRHGAHPVHFVFVSAYDRHAIEAFDLEATDYLTKPVHPTRLQRAVDRLRQKRALHAGDAKPRALGVPDRDATRLVPLDQVLFARFQSGVIELKCQERRFFLPWNLKQLEDKLLTDERFEKISRQCLVNLDEIKTITPYFSGRSIVTLSDGTELEASRGATRRLKARLL